jgi:hypothetical protein
MNRGKYRFSIIGFLLIVITGSFTSCQVVKPYQRVYLNDHEMQLGPRASQKHDTNALSYREGASGGGSGKVSGGCGCN